jgi:dTDP-4-dehydrorhamnose reductase
MTVVVTGGAGGLGREIVAAYAARGVEARSASRRTGFDLATGAGVRETLRDAEVVVHAATRACALRA